ncbi:MAG: TIM barrel protein [Hyphomicrobiales bacterium]|nr:TIM barrel protein [Hyphomicrobiales bacterium]
MMPFRFSANTGYLWRELPFLERIRQAAKYKFDAVEFHDEGQQEDRQALKDVLAETGLPVTGLNGDMGEVIGYAAIPGMAEQSKRCIADAIELAEDIGAGAIHILSGVVDDPQAHSTYMNALNFALANTKLTILIEPVCTEQLPGYFLKTVEQADSIITEIGNLRLKMLFDCYHVYRETGFLEDTFKSSAHNIGHVQIAAAEQRAEPFPGELNYGHLLPAFQQAGYAGGFGCEYRPRGATQDGLSWRAELRHALEIAAPGGPA